MTGNLDKLPAVFGRYLLLRRISRGGMGEIFLAKVGEVEGFEKPIVIKTILPDLARDEAFLSLFIEEAKVAIKLNHSNLVPVFEVGLVEDQYFLAMEYVAGQDLRALLARAREQRHRVPPDVALYLVRELANGLAYAHRRTDEAGQALELVHCDISPPNVLVSYEGEVKIIDFGVARSAMQRARDRENVGFGKFGYMAPEQLVRGQQIDRRADIYSTGVLLYELLTGERLFNFPPDVDYRTVARAVTAARFPRPSERDIKLGEQFDNLVMRALHTDPAQRYQRAEELRDAVQQQLYAMNPSVSADVPAELLRGLFGAELALEQRMQRKLSETDVAAFEFNDGPSRTVTFARAAGTLSLLRDPAAGPAAQRATQDVRASTPPRPNTAPVGAPVIATDALSQGPGTRPLSRAEQERVLDAPSDGPAQLPELTFRPVETTDPLAGARRRTLAIAGAVAAAMVVLVVLLLVAFWPEPDTVVSPLAQAKGDAHAPADAGIRVAVAENLDGAPRADEADAEPDSSEATPADAALAFAPETVLRSKVAARRARPKRRRKPRRTRRRATRATKKKAPAAPSAATVQRKFIRVRREYSRFARAYGGRLEREWQKILFANTYGQKDEAKYRQLDRLLSELLKKMSRVRSEG